MAKPYALRKFKSADDPKLLDTWVLPFAETRGNYGQFAEIDFWAGTPVVWINPVLQPYSDNPNDKRTRSAGIQLFALKEKGDDPAACRPA